MSSKIGNTVEIDSLAGRLDNPIQLFSTCRLTASCDTLLKSGRGWSRSIAVMWQMTRITVRNSSPDVRNVSTARTRQRYCDADEERGGWFRDGDQIRDEHALRPVGERGAECQQVGWVLALIFDGRLPSCSAIRTSATHRRTTGLLSPSLASIRPSERNGEKMTKANRQLAPQVYVSTDSHVGNRRRTPLVCHDGEEVGAALNVVAAIIRHSERLGT